MNRRRPLVGEDSCADCKDTCYSSKCVAEASPASGVDVVGGVVGGVGVVVSVGGVGEVVVCVLGGEGAGGGWYQPQGVFTVDCGAEILLACGMGRVSTDTRCG